MISVIISTFGDPEWEQLALERAVPSAHAQSEPAHEIITVHAETLHGARNQGAQDATGDWLLFLDADDELGWHYVESMQRKADLLTDAGHPNWLIRPATLGIRADGVEDKEPIVLKECYLLDQNFMVIGTLVPRQLFLDVGGFEDWPIYEDWDLWLRCWKAGAKFDACIDAVYRVHVREGSRNQQSRSMQTETYHRIRQQHMPLAPQGRMPRDRRKGRGRR